MRAGSKRATRDEVGHDTHVALPAGTGRVDGHLDVYLIGRLPPSIEILGEQELARPARADEHLDATVGVPVGAHLLDDGPKRRQADAAGHDHDVVTHRALGVPAGAERSAHADRVARIEPRERLGHDPDRPDRVL